ncbi:HEPN domain-containing protein [bacterium]|nr:HEPN domain-containing protein [bacterium]MBU1152422.1 HEPN domain-containing protein [bacterium]MBU2600485.1 HEPN domain-containing protein [bacterium]
MDERLNLANYWFKKADNDLKNARIVIEVEDAPIDTVCFHCQQSAEKYLKGFLIYHNIKFEKQHDLDYLIDLCCQIDSSFDSLRDIAENLTPYAVEIRYPTNPFYEYSVEEGREAIKIAEDIMVFVRKKLPVDSLNNLDNDSGGNQ